MTRIDSTIQGASVGPVDLLQVTNLSVDFPSDEGWNRVVSDLSFTLRQSEILGLVGESGSGKSVTSLAVAGLIPARGGRLSSGRVLFDGDELTALPADRLRTVRGGKIGMIFQQPTSYLNPAFTVGEQIAETLRQNKGISRDEAWRSAVAALDRVGIPRAQERVIDYPHQFSGGMCQRVMIAIALACEPKLLIADEPTTALDVTVQARILDLLRSLQKETGVAIIFITHDLSIVAEFCDRALVMYAGQAVETGWTDQLLNAPKHPYTAGLMGAARMNRENGRLVTVPGSAPRPGARVSGCRFFSRCGYRQPGRCDQTAPAMDEYGEAHAGRCLRGSELTLAGVSAS